MAVLKNLIDQRFGRLVVIEYDSKDRFGKSRWKCLCDCGTICTKNGFDLTSGDTKSCGCFLRESRKYLRRTHGMSGTPEWHTWKRMLERCLERHKTNPRYSSYAGRGIKVCERWRKSFLAFYEDLGPKPSPLHSLDRISVNGDYEPANVRWATRFEQARNKRRNRFIEHANQRLTLSEWTRKLNLSPDLLRRRLQDGWNIERALIPPRVICPNCGHGFSRAKSRINDADLVVEGIG